MTVKNIARTDVVTVQPTASIESVAALMNEEQIGSVVVVDGTEPVGLVTDRDIGIGVWQYDDPSTVTAADLMSSDPVTVDVGTEIYEALRTARSAGVRRLPLTEEGTLVGIVTLDDIIVLLAGEFEEVSNVVQSHSPPY
ncbi:MAG: CBS domain-containing protein [Halobacteriota archaeon]